MQQLTYLAVYVATVTSERRFRLQVDYRTSTFFLFSKNVGHTVVCVNAETDDSELCLCHIISSQPVSVFFP